VSNQEDGLYTESSEEAMVKIKDDHSESML
jgi:hypothetical protein